MKNVSVLALILLLLVCCGKKSTDNEVTPTPAPTDADLTKEETAASGKLRGYAQVNRLLSQRLFGRGDQLRLSYYLEPSEGGDFDRDYAAFQMLPLLGQQVGDGRSQEMINGVPNTVSSLLWYVVLEKFSADVAEVCEGKGNHSGFNSSQLRPAARDAILALCNAKADDLGFEEKFLSISKLFLLEDEPKEDRALTLELARHVIFKERSGKDSVRDLVKVILYNPNLLLTK